MKALWLLTIAPLILSASPEPRGLNMPPCWYEQFRTPDRIIPKNNHGLKRFNKDLV